MVEGIAGTVTFFVLKKSLEKGYSSARGKTSIRRELRYIFRE
jgi:hypothetical protein